MRILGDAAFPTQAIDFTPLRVRELVIHQLYAHGYYDRRCSNRKQTAMRDRYQRKPADPHELKLGKGSAFVKTKLLRLPLEKNKWETDFVSIPCPIGGPVHGYSGVVIDQDDFLLRTHSLEMPFTVNDLASLLAKAMLSPFARSSHRPAVLLIRDRPEWKDLVPHLKQLGIDVQIKKTLVRCDQVFEEILQEEQDRQADGDGRGCPDGH